MRIERPCEELVTILCSDGGSNTHVGLPYAMLLDDVRISCKILCTGEKTPSIGDVPSGNDGMFLRFKDSRSMWS